MRWVRGETTGPGSCTNTSQTDSGRDSRAKLSPAHDTTLILEVDINGEMLYSILTRV